MVSSCNNIIEKTESIFLFCISAAHRPYGCASRRFDAVTVEADNALALFTCKEVEFLSLFFEISCIYNVNQFHAKKTKIVLLPMQPVLPVSWIRMKWTLFNGMRAWKMRCSHGWKLWTSSMREMEGTKYGRNSRSALFGCRVTARSAWLHYKNRYSCTLKLCAQTIKMNKLVIKYFESALWRQTYLYVTFVLSESIINYILCKLMLMVNVPSRNTVRLVE